MVLSKKWLHSYQIDQQTILSHDNVELPVTVIGSGNPVLLLHAFGMDARQFLPFVLPLATRFKFYLPHFRGYGLASHLGTTQFDFIEQYADDLDAILTEVCQQNNVAAIPVAAISMGALVVWAYLSRYLHDTNDLLNIQHKISRYLNIDQVPAVHNQPNWQGGVFGDNQIKIFAKFKQVLQQTLPYLEDYVAIDNDTNIHLNKPINSDSGSTRVSIDKVSIDSQFIHLPYAVKRNIIETERRFAMMAVSRKHTRWLTNITRYQTPYKLGLYNDDTWQQKMRCLHAYVTLPYDYRAGIDSITMPTTFLIGGQSQLYHPKWQREIAQQLPHSTIIELPKSGHAVPLDAPIKFAKVLKDFLGAP